MRRDRSRTIIALGFGAVFALMAALTFSALQVLDASSQRLEMIVNTNNLKSELIVRMRTAARERTLGVHRMLLTDDPFKLDDEWMRINRLASEFIEARDALKHIATPNELELLELQSRFTNTVSPMLAQVAELVISGERAEAERLLLERVLPGQDRLLQVLAELSQIQKDEASHTASETRTDRQAATALILLMAASIALVSILIAIYVVRRTGDSERRLLEEKERAEITLHSIGEGVITTDALGRIERMNMAAELLTGWTSQQAEGKPLLHVMRMIRESDQRLIDDPVSRALRDGCVCSSAPDTLLARRDGREAAIEFTAAPIMDRWQNRMAGTILVFRDVTETRALATQLAHQARHDSLTSLINRREFESRLQQTLAEAHRYPEQHHWLCYLDLDQFKVINDTCGHMAGDELLKQIAGHLKREMRDSDLVARMGGDEFAILLKNCDAEGAREIVERVRRVLHDLRFAWDNKSFSSSASIGMVPIGASSGTLYDLLSAADKACYVAKDQGRNRIHIYLQDDDAVARHEGEMEWVHRIRRALEEDRFVLYYQPIRRLDNGIDGHWEILLRMLDEDGEIVPPMAFIPAAERYNLMGEVDRWVVRTTLAQLQDACQHHCSLESFVAINLSAQSLCDDAFLPFVLEQLHITGMPAHRLCFEITETAAIANLSRAQEVIHTLKGRGCRFSLDDFGSGLSSFGYLKTLSVDYLKIDGTFVRDILDDPMDRAMVESINQIGHVMQIATIAEYVEQPQTLKLLQQIGVDYGQGYAVAAPKPLSELVRALEQGTAEKLERSSA